VQNRAIDILRQLRERGIDVSTLCVDSRTVQPGDVFLAYPGAAQDGRDHIAGAIAAGAAAVLWERAGFEWDEGWRVPGLPVEGLRPVAGHLADEVYGRPSERLWVMGVTGTNGKTSCSQWLAQACGACGARTAVIGTLGTGFPGALVPGPNTTPDAVAVHRSLGRLLDEGAQGVAMEVSSIGLDQDRVNGVRFGVALYTNLSRDHLEYHGDMESYAQAKQRLFDLFYKHPEPLVPRHRVLEVTEKVAPDGSIRQPLALDGLLETLDRLIREDGVQSVAVCLLHAYANPTHEEAVERALAERFPGLHVSLSSDVLPRFREYERASTVVMSAYTKPVVDRYLGHLERRLSDGGFTGHLNIIQANGGSVPAPAIRPVSQERLTKRDWPNTRWPWNFRIFPKTATD